MIHPVLVPLDLLQNHLDVLTVCLSGLMVRTFADKAVARVGYNIGFERICLGSDL